MKTFVVIVCVLAITTVVYGFNHRRLELFYENLLVCSHEAKEPMIMYRSDLFHCAVKKDRIRMYGQNNRHLKDSMLQLIEDCIQTEAEIKWAQKFYEKCYDKYFNDGITVEQEEENIFNCSVSIIFHFPPPDSENRSLLKSL